MVAATVVSAIDVVGTWGKIESVKTTKQNNSHHGTDATLFGCNYNFRHRCHPRAQNGNLLYHFKPNGGTCVVAGVGTFDQRVAGRRDERRAEPRRGAGPDYDVVLRGGSQVVQHDALRVFGGGGGGGHLQVVPLAELPVGVLPVAQAVVAQQPVAQLRLGRLDRRRRATTEP